MMTQTRRRRRWSVALGLLLLFAARAGTQTIADANVRAQLIDQVRKLQSSAAKSGRINHFDTFRDTTAIHFILDPNLAKATSYGYTPYGKNYWTLTKPNPLRKDITPSPLEPIRVSLLDSEVQALKDLVKAEGRDPVRGYGLAGDAVRDFFELLSENRTRHPDLKTFLRSERGLSISRAIPLFAVQPRFWVEDRGKEATNLLCCRLEIRGFWMRLERYKLKEYPDLVACEMFYHDTAEGRVELNNQNEGAVALKRAIYAAFFNQLAVSFCLNAVVQSALASSTESPVRIGKFRGVSITEHVEGVSR